MQDIQVIAKLNADACVRAIKENVAAGKHALISKAGLHIVDVDFADSRELAEAWRNARIKRQLPSEHYEILSPEQTSALAAA